MPLLHLLWVVPACFLAVVRLINVFKTAQEEEYQEKGMWEE